MGVQSVSCSSRSVACKITQDSFRVSVVWCERWKEADGKEEGAPKLMKNKRRPRATEAATAAITEEGKEGWASKREGRARSEGDTHRAAAPALGGAKISQSQPRSRLESGPGPLLNFPRRTIALVSSRSTSVCFLDGQNNDLLSTSKLRPFKNDRPADVCCTSSFHCTGFRPFIFGQ